MTAQSIGSGAAPGYASYLDGRTQAPERGDYYLGRDGEPAEAPGRWHAGPETLGALGVDPDAPVQRDDLLALMEGRRPGTTPEDADYIRPAGADGTRAAGIDVTFSAPKSVSIAWALSPATARAVVEAAHGHAVERSLAYLRDRVEIVALDGGLVTASDLLAAEFRHTTARGVAGGSPDPQLHSHVVITSATRADGSVAAVRSRPILRAARELGAYYRAALARELRAQGYDIEPGTGKHGRYFELAGIDADAREAFSRRSREVARAAERFRARHGRAPERGELRTLKLESRAAKTPTTRGALDGAWQQVASAHGLTPEHVAALHRPVPGRVPADLPAYAERVERALTAERAIFTTPELRATTLEQAAGEHDPDRALGEIPDLHAAGRILELADGRLTTLGMRAREAEIADRLRRMGTDRAVEVTAPFRVAGIAAVELRLGARLSEQQRDAVRVLTGPERAAALIGRAGTGKGVVIDAVARAELAAARELVGVAVAGATAERLGRDAPALADKTMTIDALLARQQSNLQVLNRRTTVIVDEAAMIDTDRFARLVAAVDPSGAKLLLVGDGRQLPSIGPGGMFDRIGEVVAVAELTEIRRTADVSEQQAWECLRRGEPERALAHYRARGQLHLTDTREGALEAAVQHWDRLRRERPLERIALMTDGPNREIDRLNARAQQLRLERGELGQHEVALPGDPAGGAEPPAYGVRMGDRVAWASTQWIPGEPRVENGTRGEIIAAAPESPSVFVRLDGSGREVRVEGAALGRLRLGYALHVYRQQGATVDRALVLTGGWQTSRENAYVEASRAREGTDWYVAREDLGTEGTDGELDARLAEAMSTSRSQEASLGQPLARYATELEVATLARAGRVAELAPDPPRAGRTRDRGRDIGLGVREQVLDVGLEID